MNQRTPLNFQSRNRKRYMARGHGNYLNTFTNLLYSRKNVSAIS